MQKAVLSNGMTLLYKRMPTESVAVQVLVKVGSNNEPKQLRGITHFIEHMVFEGTEKRPNSREIANEIERIGGEFNAYTTNERTCFYVKVLHKHFGKALDVLSDMLLHSLFREKDINKEKNIVLKEIDMVNDEPRFYQWVLFQKVLFTKHPSRFPTYGRKETIKALKQKEVVQYFKAHYVPSNILLSVAGNVGTFEQVKKKIEQLFTLSPGIHPHAEKNIEPFERKIKLKKEKRKITNSYVVLGFKAVPRAHADSYALEVVDAILGRGQSGWLFDEIRAKRGLAYEVSTQLVSETDYGYFAIYLSTDKKKIPLTKKLIFDELEKLKSISDADLAEAKEYLEGSFYMDNEDTQKLADTLGYWEHVKDVRLFSTYLQKIKKVTAADVKRVVQKYLRKDRQCMVVIEGK